MRSLLRTDVYHRALPWTRLMLRHRCFVRDLNLRPFCCASAALLYVLLGSLAGAYWQPLLGVVAGAAVIALILLNMPVYRFFMKSRGVAFTVRAVLWHWFYYAYSSAAFAMGTVHYFWTRRCPGARGGIIR
jgi:hypothetical protein